MKKLRVKIILKIKNKRVTKFLDSLDRRIDKELKFTGDYPKNLALTSTEIQEMKKEIKEAGLSHCWADSRFGSNYRGIPVVLKK